MPRKNKMTDEIRKELKEMQDSKYGDFQVKLIPGKDRDCIIGVRTPDLRKYAKRLVKREDIGDFLSDLPHKFFDEDQLHAFIVSEIRDYDRCMEEVCRFLPYVDNWATCDQMSPKVFAKHKSELAAKTKEWINDDKTYTIRFGIGMLMQYFLDDDFDPKYPKMVAAIRSDEYYVNMMIAWYFATALAKQYDAVIEYMTGRKLDEWTHKKTIQKCVESYRVSDEHKEFLKSLR